MNQPKFKFTDTLVTEMGNVFQPCTIELIQGLFYYSGRIIKGCGSSVERIPEIQVNAYVEPKPNKLYAMSDEYGFIYFQKSDKALNSGYTREAEYDLEYPLK